jgi:hypothetical protein
VRKLKEILSSKWRGEGRPIKTGKTMKNVFCSVNVLRTLYNAAWRSEVEFFIPAKLVLQL